MRLHRLEAQAFGPFAERVEVDFDALSESGLFLLTGATGAGKTSVLDAVCFALYGEVPGDRQAAKRLRSDQAEAGVAPRVSLELSLGGRRFRVERTPAWERPKKRGSGTTTEQASVRLSERLDGAWQPLSSRLDEAGHQIGLLVGMNLAQFCQVAMLPQGRFQAFLRARSEERHRLLQQLFRTGRFEDVERWLRERRLELRRESRRHHERVADLLSRVSEAAAVPLPGAWDLHDLDAPGDQLSRWSGQCVTAAAACATTAAARAATAAETDRLSAHALERARRLAADQATHAAARAEHARLEADAGAHVERAAALAAARRAARVAPLHQVALVAESAAAQADRTARRLLDAIGTDADALPDLLREAREGAAAARALLPRQARLVAARAEAQAAGAAVSRLRERLASFQAAEELAAARDELAGLRARAEAHDHGDRVEATLTAARADLAAAHDLLMHRKEEWLRLQEERIHGMAAELAGALAVGHDCPVCGSVDHPRPAAARAGAPDATAEKAARRLVDDAEVLRQSHEERVRTLAAELAVARERAGETRELHERLAATTHQIARLERDHPGPPPSSDRDATAAELVAAESTHLARLSEVTALEAELAAALERTDADDLASLAADLDARAASCQTALEAVAECRRSATAAASARVSADGAAVAAGFGDLAAAVAAALDDRSASLLEAEVRGRENALARVTALLDDPDLRAAADLEPPDLTALVTASSTAAAAATEAAAAREVAAARATRLTGLDEELGAELDRWQPVRAELALATRVAALCDGTSPDNRLQMRLSGYVLAWRLAQVVAAANERLARMSDQRYSLEHTGRRGAGENRGGLSLLVRDDWSGQTRDPATLSGGETFVVSLALALGLADVVAHEVGGAELDTLFVDEGFGSLDADTLDDVMDTLDTLRDGGRVVGVVSHVAEMRDRIPTQLRVVKSRRGSSLALSRT